MAAIAAILNIMILITLSQSKFTLSLQNVLFANYFANLVLLALVRSITFDECFRAALINLLLTTISEATLIMISAQMAIPQMISIHSRLLFLLLVAVLRAIIPSFISSIPWIAFNEYCGFAESDTSNFILDAITKLILPITSLLSVLVVARRLARYHSAVIVPSTLLFCAVLSIPDFIHSIITFAFIEGTQVTFAQYVIWTDMIAEWKLVIAPLILLMLNTNIRMAFVKILVYTPIYRIGNLFVFQKRIPDNVLESIVVDEGSFKRVRAESNAPNRKSGGSNSSSSGDLLKYSLNVAMARQRSSSNLKDNMHFGA